MPAQRNHENVHVVGGNNKLPQPIARFVEMTQCTPDKLAQVGTLEQAFSMTLVQPLFPAHVEQPIVIRLGLSLMGLRILAQPRFPFSRP